MTDPRSRKVPGANELEKLVGSDFVSDVLDSRNHLAKHGIEEERLDFEAARFNTAKILVAENILDRNLLRGEARAIGLGEITLPALQRAEFRAKHYDLVDKGQATIGDKRQLHFHVRTGEAEWSEARLRKGHLEEIDENPEGLYIDILDGSSDGDSWEISGIKDGIVIRPNPRQGRGEMAYPTDRRGIIDVMPNVDGMIMVCEKREPLPPTNPTPDV